MGQLFDRALRKGFSDVFDSAYGGSALENRLKGALASSLYDARLSSSGYNKARTRTVEDELANRQELLKRAMAGSDPTAVDRVLAGPGHAQDQMKGTVGRAREDRVVGELERLEALGTPKAMDYRSGAITGSNRGQIGAGRLSEEKMSIARENEDALTAALGKVTEMGIDPKTKEGQSLIVEIMARGKPVSGTDLKNMLTTESTIGANIARADKYKAQGLAALGSMESQKQYREDKIRIQEDFNTGRLDIGKIKATAYADWKSAESVLANEKVQVQKAKVHEIEISALLKENKIDKVKAEIKNANSKTKAEIKRIDQLVNSGTIKDLEVRENTRLIGERMKTEVKKREKMSATIDKLHKEADNWDEVIKKTRAQTKAEELDMGLALMEFLGLDTKTASGDSMRNNYTKMYVKIMEEDPILREPDPDNPGQERDIVINITDDNPEGQKKLFSHLNADDQKTYIQSRLIDERQQSYAMTGKTLHPKIKAIVDSMMESFTKPGEAITNELMNMPDGEEKSTAYSVSPQDNKNRMNMPVQPQTAGQPPAAVDTGSDLASALGQFAGTGEMQFDDSQVADALQASNAGVQDDLTAVQSVPTDVTGGDIKARQDAGKDEALQKMVSENGWSSNIATIFSDAIATQVISPVSAEKLAKMSVVQLQELITAQQGNKNFATDILPIVQAMIADKQAGG